MATAPPCVTPSHVRSTRRVPYCFPMRTGLREGDRVALLVSPSLEYLDVVIGLLAAGVVPIPLDPRLTTFERERILAGLSPTLQVTTAEQLGSCMPAYPDHRGLPRARPMHCTSGTTGTPKGVWSGPLSDVDAAALVAEERSLWGFARQRREPGALAALPLRAAEVRHGHGAGGRPGRRARPVRPGAGHGGDRAGAADVHVLRADAPAAAVRALGRASARRTCRRSGSSHTPGRRARTR